MDQHLSIPTLTCLTLAQPQEAFNKADTPQTMRNNWKGRLVKYSETNLAIITENHYEEQE